LCFSYGTGVCGCMLLMFLINRHIVAHHVLGTHPLFSCVGTGTCQPSAYGIEAFFSMCVFFFFQAEDGIRDFHVTGVQTCALPIFPFYHTGRFLSIPWFDVSPKTTARASSTLVTTPAMAPALRHCSSSCS